MAKLRERFEWILLAESGINVRGEGLGIVKKNCESGSEWGLAVPKAGISFRVLHCISFFSGL